MPVRVRILAVTAHSGGPAAERAVDIADGAGEIRIGRRPDLELPLPFAALSPLHARIFRDGGGGWMLEDLGGDGGTWLDAERLAPGTPRRLRSGTEVMLAQVALIFDGELAAGTPPGEGTATIARRLVSDLLAGEARAGTPELEVVAGPDLGRRLALRESDRPYLAGRGTACDLPLLVEETSREHATFVWTAEGVTVRDHGSKNGVQVAGARIDGTRRLRDGDLVALGPVTLRLHDPIDRHLRQVAGPAPEAEALSPTLPRKRGREMKEEERVPVPRASRTTLVTAFAIAVLVAVIAAATIVVLAG